MVRDTTPSLWTVGRWQHAGNIILMGVLVALCTGLVEVLTLAFRYAVLGQIIFTSRELVWMTPASYVLLFLPTALLLALAALVRPRLVPLHVAGFLFVLAGVGSQLLPFTQIHRIAAFVVAIGVATQGARWIRTRQASVPAFARRAVPAIAALIVVLGAGVRLTRSLTEGGTSGALPPARAGAPNVLLLVWDTARAASLGLYGHVRPTTPELDQWSRLGTVFEQAMSTSPWTLPSHASMFTGRWPHELSADWFVPLDDSTPTLAEAFTANGYATGGFVANLHYTAYDSRLDRGFHRYADYRTSLDQTLRSSWLAQTPLVRSLLRARSAGDVVAALRSLNFDAPRKRDGQWKWGWQVNGELLAWLDELEEGEEKRPFFAFLNYMEPHLGPAPPPGFADRFPSDTPMVQRYDGALSYADQSTKALLDSLRARGLLNNTILILTSDHGELLGEHKIFGHAHNLYLPVLHVPLAIVHEGHVPRDRRISEPVSLRDLAATIADLAGLETNANFPGRSLARHWRDAADTVPEPLLSEVRAVGVTIEPHLPTSKGSMRSVRHGSWRVIENGDGRLQLFDLATDPGENRDLSASPATGPRLDSLRALLGPVPPDFLPPDRRAAQR